MAIPFVNRKLLRLRQAVERSSPAVRSAPWVLPVHRALVVILDGLARKRPQDDSQLRDWEDEVVASADLIAMGLDAVERGAGVRVPHYLLGPLSRILNSYLHPKRHLIALVSWRMQFNYNLDKTLGPFLAALVETCASSSVPTRELRDLLEALNGLVIVAVPTGDEDDALQHCLVSHELGHVISEESSKLRPIREAPVKLSKSLLSDRDASVALSWFGELQCDLLATHMIGPSFPLALGARVPMAGFSRSHPSTSARLLACRLGLRRCSPSDLPPVVRKALDSHVPTHEQLRGEVGSQLQGSTVSLSLDQFEAGIDRLADAIWAAFGHGYGYGAQAFRDGAKKVPGAVNALVNHVPPACSLVGTNNDEGTVQQEPEDPKSIWLAGWLVELDAKLWHRFSEPLRQTKDEDEHQAQAARKLSLLVGKGLEASETLTCLREARSGAQGNEDP
jgi:hypothetical protein